MDCDRRFTPRQSIVGTVNSGNVSDDNKLNFSKNNNTVRASRANFCSIFIYQRKEKLEIVSINETDKKRSRCLGVKLNRNARGKLLNNRSLLCIIVFSDNRNSTTMPFGFSKRVSSIGRAKSVFSPIFLFFFLNKTSRCKKKLISLISNLNLIIFPLCFKSCFFRMNRQSVSQIDEKKKKEIIKNYEFILVGIVGPPCMYNECR